MFSAGNDSKGAAQNVSHTLMMYDKGGRKVLLSNQGSDAGGGATREDFGNKLEIEGRVKDRYEYNVATCSLHALNLCLSSPTELTMGSGGLKKRTALQLLHSAYNLAQCFRHQE